MKFRDFFYNNQSDQIKNAGYNTEQEVNGEILTLHQKLQELDKKGEGHIDFSSEDIIINETKLEFVETLEKKEQMTIVARNIINSFGFKPNIETMMVITDTGVIKAQPELISAIQTELENRTDQSKTKGNFRIRVLPETKRSAEDMGDYVMDEMENLRGSPLLIITSMSRSHSKETGVAIRGLADRDKLDITLKSAKEAGHLASLGDKLSNEQWEKLNKFAKSNSVRLISITKGKNPHEILTKGAVEAPIEEILEKDKKVNELMKDVERVHITSPDGTNLQLSLIKETKGFEGEDFSKPGSMGNYPIGEWACSLNWEGSNGVLVVNGPIGGEHMLDQVKEHGPVRLIIKEGEIIEINGQKIFQDSNNPLIESIKAYLNAGNNRHNNAYRLAELGIGTNRLACREKEDGHIGSSEGEKIYGTAHIAFGSNGSLGVPKNHPSFNSAKVHCDMVLMGSISVQCIDKYDNKFYLIKDGQPKGY